MDRENLWTRRQRPSTDLNKDAPSRPFPTKRTSSGIEGPASRTNPGTSIAPLNTNTNAPPGKAAAFGLGSGAFASFGSATKTPKTPGTAFDFSKASLGPQSPALESEKASRAPHKASQAFEREESGKVADAKGLALKFSWVIWYRPPTAKNTDYEKSIKPMYKMRTVQEFWRVYIHLKRPSALPTVSDYHFFRGGIRPVWEDEENKRGGKWILRLKKGVIDRYWEDILLATVGDQFAEAGEEVCGLVVSVRSGEDVMSIWTKFDNGRNVKIRETIKRVLNLPADTNIVWKSHDDSIAQRSAIDQARQERERILKVFAHSHRSTSLYGPPQGRPCHLVDSPLQAAFSAFQAFEMQDPPSEEPAMGAMVSLCSKKFGAESSSGQPRTRAASAPPKDPPHVMFTAPTSDVTNYCHDLKVAPTSSRLLSRACTYPPELEATCSPANRAPFSHQPSFDASQTQSSNARDASNKAHTSSFATFALSTTSRIRHDSLLPANPANMSRAPDGSFRPNNYLNRNNAPQKTYGRKATLRGDSASQWFSSTRTAHGILSRHSSSPRRSSDDLDAPKSAVRLNKRRRLSTNTYDVDLTRDTSESPKPVARPMVSHGSGRPEYRSINRNGFQIQEGRTPSIGGNDEYRYVDDMMNPNGKRAWPRAHSSHSYASSPDELHSSRSLSASQSKVAGSTRPSPLNLKGSRVIPHKKAADSSVPEDSNKPATSVAEDEIEDSEPDRRREHVTRRASRPLDQCNQSGQTSSMKVRPASPVDMGEDELLQDHAHPRSPGKRAVASEDFHLQAKQTRQARKPPSRTSDQMSDAETKMKPTVFVCAKKSDAPEVTSMSISLYHSLRFHAQLNENASLQFTKDCRQLGISKKTSETKYIDLDDIAKVDQSQEARAVLMHGRHHEGAKPFNCFIRFSRSSDYECFARILEDDFGDIRVKLESQASIEKTYSNIFRREPQTSTSSGAKSENTNGRSTSSMQDRADRPERRARLPRHDYDEIKYEPQEAPNTTRRTRSSTGAVRQRIKSPTPPLKYSETVGLGKRWPTPLLYPRSGLGRATVDFDDLRRLDEGDMLNDQLIFFCLRYAQLKSVESANRVYIFNSFLYDSMSKAAPGKKVNYEQVKNWTRRVNIFKDYDYVVIPINENYHWYVVIICNTTCMRPESIMSIDEDDVGVPAETVAKSSQQGDGDEMHRGTALEQRRSRSSSVDAALSRKTAKISFEESDEKKPDGERKSSSLGETSPRQTSNAPSRGSRKLIKRNPLAPAILYLDSLKMPHPATTTRLKAYLEAEAKTKEGWNSIKLAPGAINEKSVPGQNNLSDCGVYLIGYVSNFLQNPARFIELQAQGILDQDEAWTRLDPAVMRGNIRAMIQHERHIMDMENDPKKAGSVVRAHPPTLASAFDEFTARMASPQPKPEPVEEKSAPLAIADAPPTTVDKDMIRQARTSKLFTSPNRPSNSLANAETVEASRTTSASAPTTPLVRDTKDKKLKKPLRMTLVQAMSSSSPGPSSDGRVSEHLKRKQRSREISPTAEHPPKKQHLNAAKEGLPVLHRERSLTPILPSEGKSSGHRRNRSASEMALTAQETLREVEGGLGTSLPSRYSSLPRSSPPIVIEDSQEGVGLDKIDAASPADDEARSSTPAARKGKQRSLAATNNAIINLDEDLLGDSRRSQAEGFTKSVGGQEHPDNARRSLEMQKPELQPIEEVPGKEE